MGPGIYKKNQGFYTRVCSAIAMAVLVLLGAKWVWDQLGQIRMENSSATIYVQATGAALLVAIFGFIGYYYIGRKQRVVDFMIATEGEMKKVNWSTRREILGSTWIVIGLTIFIALFCFAFDWFFSSIFRWMEVLDT